MQTAIHFKSFDFEYFKSKAEQIDKSDELDHQGRIDALVKLVRDESSYRPSERLKIVDYKISVRGDDYLTVVFIYECKDKLPTVDYIDVYRRKA